MSNDLEVRESRKRSFTESIISVLEQWKELETQFNSTQKDFKGRNQEIESKEKDLQKNQESLEQRIKESQDKEKDLVLFYKRRVLILDLEEEELSRIKESYSKEIEEKLNDQEKLVEGLLSKLQYEKIEMQGIKNLVEKRVKEMGLKVFKSFEKQRKEIKVLRDSIDKKALEIEYKKRKIDVIEKTVEEKEKEILNKLTESEKEFELKEKEFKFMTEEVEFAEQNVDFLRELNENRAKDLDMKEKELEMELENMVKAKKSEKNLLEKECEHLESRIKDKLKDFELKEKELEQFSNDLQCKERECRLTEDLFEQESKDFESRNKELEERIKNLESREKEIESQEMKQQQSVHPACVKMESMTSDNVPFLDRTHISYTQQFNRNFNAKHYPVPPPHGTTIPVMATSGRDLQIWLNEQENNHHLLSEEVLRILQLSNDPATLVLDAMEGFYPPHLRTIGNREFPTYAVRKSCIFLLQLLIRISPWIQIPYSVRCAAFNIAREWRLKITPTNLSEVCGFLNLIDCFGLHSEFFVEDIRYLVTVAH